MTLELDDHPLSAAYAAILSQGLDGAGEALRFLVNRHVKLKEPNTFKHSPLSELNNVRVMLMVINLKRS